MNNALDDNEKDSSKYHPSIPNFFSLLNPSLFFPHSYYLQIRKIKNKKQFHSTFIMLNLGNRRIFFSYAKGIVFICTFSHNMLGSIIKCKYHTSKKHWRLWFYIKNVLHHNLCLDKEKNTHIIVCMCSKFICTHAMQVLMQIPRYVL